MTSLYCGRGSNVAPVCSPIHMYKPIQLPVRTKTWRDHGFWLAHSRTWADPQAESPDGSQQAPFLSFFLSFFCSMFPSLLRSSPYDSVVNSSPSLPLPSRSKVEVFVKRSRPSSSTSCHPEVDGTPDINHGPPAVQMLISAWSTRRP